MEKKQNPLETNNDICTMTRQELTKKKKVNIPIDELIHCFDRLALHERKYQKKI